MNKKIKINLTEHDVSFFSLWAEAVNLSIEELIERIVRDIPKRGTEKMLIAIKRMDEKLDSSNPPKCGSGVNTPKFDCRIEIKKGEKT